MKGGLELVQVKIMNILNIKQICHGICRWVISAFAALMLSSLVNFVHADELKTFSLVIDNDILVPNSTDQDYTGGINFSYVAEKANHSAFYFADALDFIDGALGVSESKLNLYGVEAGLYGFTPSDTQQVEITSDDRPYSSLLYFSNLHERVDLEKQQAWQTRLTFGFLGLDIFENLQEGIHNITASQQPKGWHQQVSDGGEPTFRYQVSRQSAIDLGLSNFELKHTQQLSLGYISETGLSVSGRYGQFNSSWWNFNPEMSSYGEQRNSLSGDAGERFLFFGGAVKLRAYNSFLQGQFRQSEHSLSHSQLNHVIAEAWAGYTHSLSNGFQLSYIIRAQSSEIKNGVGDRSLIWGGISLSKSFY